MGEVGTFYGAADTNGGSNITVSTPDIVHPIDLKYLPSGMGGGLPVVELETVLNDDTNQLSVADIEKLSAAMVTKMPVIIRFSYMGELEYCALFFWMGTEGIEIYYARMQGFEVIIANYVGSWQAIVQSIV